jgi:hypothetical protein
VNSGDVRRVTDIHPTGPGGARGKFKRGCLICGVFWPGFPQECRPSSHLHAGGTRPYRDTLPNGGSPPVRPLWRRYQRFKRAFQSIDDLSSVVSFLALGWEEDAGNGGNTSLGFRGPRALGLGFSFVEFTGAGAAGELDVGIPISAAF